MALPSASAEIATTAQVSARTVAGALALALFACAAPSRARTLAGDWDAYLAEG